MALTTRYFDHAGAGAADGTTWADRANLYTGGAWSSVITAHDFGTNGPLLCYVGPGTVTIGSNLAQATFSVSGPSTTNYLIFHGCDSSGNPLSPPDPDWKSCQPDWDSSGLPLLRVSTTKLFNSIDALLCRLIRCEATSFNGEFIESGNDMQLFDWCKLVNSTSGASVAVMGWQVARGTMSNCVLACTGTQYAAALNIPNTSVSFLVNTRIRGNPSASAGLGIRNNSGQGTFMLSHCTIVNHPGAGIDASPSTSASNWVTAQNCVLAGNGGDGWKGHGAATVTGGPPMRFSRCMVTGNGGYGLNPNTNSPVWLTRNRFRDNTSGAYNTLPLSLPAHDDYTTDSDDASEYVGASTGDGDWTIKAGATIHGMGFGVSEQAAAGGGRAAIIGG